VTDAPPVIDTAFLAAAAAADLEDWGPLAEATEEGTPMSTRGLTIWSAPDSSGAEAGIWECTAGPSYWRQEQTEVIYVLSGSLTVTPDGGQPATLGPGDVAIFPRGWRGPWELHETVRKVYVLF
jgi:hypothetical protein